MTHNKPYRLISILILAAVFILSAPLVSIAGEELTVKFKSKIQLNQETQNKLIGASRELITKNFSADFARGIGSQAETNVLRQTAKGYVAETIVLNLLKNTYTAEMSKLEFSHEAGQTKLLNIKRNYRPSFAESMKAVAADAKLQGEKQKLNVFKASKVPDDPRQFKTDALIKDAEAAEAREAHHSWWNARGLANTHASSIPSAVAMTNNIHAVMYSRFGGSAAKRIGAASTEAEITDFLKNDAYLLAWNNIGHGVTGASGSPCYGLVQWGGTMWYNEIAAISPPRGLYHSVSLANSCNSFKNPLNAAIWSRLPRTYIGGNINLPIGNSETAAYHFWYRTLLLKWPMATALTKAQQDLGFPLGTFGLRGYNGVF
jgi:hypothetical protein